ncbi:MAG: alpha/beta fold hydrolase [Rhodobacteraceae bacterium]|nr:alpha/beta fold hydrolase [Paracoccaceae bacterium]
MWQTGGRQDLVVNGTRLEYQCWGPSPDQAMSLVLLHEGLGSVSLWRGFPEALAKATGCGVLAYSRAGYGQSDPATLPRPLDYMTREAVEVLPRVLDQIGVQQGVLLGHSDGASIAAIYAGTFQDRRIRGICLFAPHFFTEPGGLASIAEAKIAYESTDLKSRMARHHKDAENTFRGWNDAWLDPEFVHWNIEDVIGYIRVPVLAIQGEQDQYGSLRQLDALENGLYSPFDRVVLENCAHAPHLDQADATLDAVAEFVARLKRIEAARVDMHEYLHNNA